MILFVIIAWRHRFMGIAAYCVAAMLLLQLALVKVLSDQTIRATQPQPPQTRPRTSITLNY